MKVFRDPRWFVAIALVVISAALLFVRLGHYPLWDDEAQTALGSEGILRTGDTTAVIDHNVVGYGGGILLHNLHDRSTPPLPAYLAAPFLAVLKNTSLAARLPFALLGISCVIVMLRWAWRDGATLVSHLMLTAAIVGNVSFFLYFRNCRYYGCAIFCSVAIAYLYVHFNGSRRSLIPIVLLSCALLASNYLDYVALYVCLAVDYLLFAQHLRLRALDWLILLGPQIVIGLIVLSIWNPFGTGNSASFWANGIIGKWIVFGRSWRDINACEYGALPLLLAAPLLRLKFRSSWLLRGPLALFVFMILMALIAPTPIERSQYADVRYYAPIIPLCIGIEVVVMRQLWSLSRVATVVVAALAFGTNLLHFGFFRSEGVRSTIVDYVGELAHPPADPYSAATAFVRKNVKPGETIGVIPPHETYPLMFHVPWPLYAWQFTPPPRGQLANLPPIEFHYQGNPDWVIVFGPALGAILDEHVLENRSDVEYVPFERLGVYWQDRYRPELMFRSFKPVRYDPRPPHFQDVYVFKGTPKPAKSPSTQPAGAGTGASGSGPSWSGGK